METKLNELIAALTEVTKRLGDISTGRGAERAEDSDPSDPFNPEASQKEKDNKSLAEAQAEAHFKAKEKYDKSNNIDYKTQADVISQAHFKAKSKYDKANKPPRKVVEDNKDGAILQALHKIGVSLDKWSDKKIAAINKKWSDMGDWGLISTLLVGAAAVVAGVMSAISGFFTTIWKSKWFRWLKGKGLKAVRGYWRMISWPFRKIGNALSKGIKAVKSSKWFKNIKNFFKPVGDFFRKITTAIKNNKVGKLVGDLFKPVSDWFKRLKMKMTGGTGKFTFSSVGKYLKDLFMGTPEKPGIFSKIGQIFVKIKDFIMKNPAMRTAIKVGGTIGRLLGKIFLPLTIILGVYDGVTGFMDGYEEDGIIGGIKGAVIGIVDGLIGGLIRMIEGGMKWVAEALGLKNFAAAINPSGFLQPVYDAFGGVVDFIAGIFTLDLDRMWKGIKGFFGGALDLGQWFIETPINMCVNFLKDIFGFGDPDVPFDFGDWFEETIWGPTVNFFTGIGDWWDDVWAESKRRWEAGVASIKKFFTSIGDWFSDVWEETARRWDKGVENIKNFFGSIGNWFSDVYDRSLERWNRGVENIKRFFSSIGDWFSDIYEESLRRFNQGVENIKKFFSDIGNWFSEKWDSFTGYLGDVWDGLGMLFSDPKEALKKIIPEWAQDFFGWMGDKLSGVWSGITGIFDEIANFDVGDWVKKSIKEHPGGAWLYDKLWGEEEKFAAAAAKEKKMLSGELKSNVSDSAAIDEIVKETQAAGVKAGGDTYAERTTKLYDKMRTAVSDAQGDKSKMLKKLSSSDERKILAYAAYAEGLDIKDKRAVDAFWNKMAGGYEDVWGTMNTSKSADGYMSSIANTSAGLQLGQEKHDAGVNALLRHIKSTGQVQIGGAIIPVDTEDRWPPKLKSNQVFTPAMIKGFQDIAKSKKQGDKLYKGALDRMGISKAIADEIVRLKKLEEAEAAKLPVIRGELDPAQYENQTPALDKETQDRFDQNPPLTQEQFKMLSGQVGSGKKLDDFIWRPGDDPVAFNKGDLLMGIHEETGKRMRAQSLTGTPNTDKQLLGKLDVLCQIMNEHSEIHKQTLKTLHEAGLTKDGDSANVVGNNSNNTTINNVQQDQSIITFRDRTLGRIQR